MKNGAIFKFFILSLLSIILFSCGEDDSNPKSEFGIFKVIDNKVVEMDGEISSSTLNDFNELIEFFPNINLINITEVPGSSDDEINLKVSKKVHQQNIAIHLEDNGLIASGGVDFFLSGTTRTSGNNTMIGVHSWSDGTNEASDFPIGHSSHRPYIEYYKSVGFDQNEAEAFYFYTIHAAPASSIHYMSMEEIEQYKILKP